MRSATRVLAQFAAALAVAAMATAASAQENDFRVTLLGTGTPPPIMKRFGPATLVEVGGQVLMFDAGRGATQRLWQAKVPLGKVRPLFLTHLHSDHVVGIPGLMLTGWLNSPFGRRKGKFEVVGPAGTKDMMNHLRIAYDWDIQTRIVDQGFTEEGVTPVVTEIRDGAVWERDGVKVTAIEVFHGEKIKPAFGYRVDYDGRSVAISGDTKYSENFVKAARGADLIVHSVAGARQELLDSAKFWSVILTHHSLPQDAGRVFAETKPKMAVYTHLALLTNGKIKPLTYDMVEEMTRETYDGPLMVGLDLMSFDITDKGVMINKPK